MKALSSQHWSKAKQALKVIFQIDIIKWDDPLTWLLGDRGLHSVDNVHWPIIWLILEDLYSEKTEEVLDKCITMYFPGKMIGFLERLNVKSMKKSNGTCKSIILLIFTWLCGYKCHLEPSSVHPSLGRSSLFSLLFNASPFSVTQISKSCKLLNLWKTCYKNPSLSNRKVSFSAWAQYYYRKIYHRGFEALDQTLQISNEFLLQVKEKRTCIGVR